MRSQVKLFLAFLVLLASISSAQDTQIAIARSIADPNPHIVLVWNHVTGVVSYNLYRKTDPNSGFPDEPLNSMPISPIMDCQVIKSILTEGSVEWKAIKQSLTEDPNAPFNPCDIGTALQDQDKRLRLEMLSRASWKISVCIGSGFDDRDVEQGITYYYQLQGIDASGASIGIIAEADIKAGVLNLSTPDGIEAKPGDSNVLLLWEPVKEAAGYCVERRAASEIDYKRVNSSQFSLRFTEDPTKEGFLDALYWDSDGQPTTHKVLDEDIGGPINGTEYFYRVAAMDLLGQMGNYSSEAPATPKDKTPPAIPGGVTVIPIQSQRSILIRWNTVSYDSEGHKESSNIDGYQVFRYASPNVRPEGGKRIGTLVPQPAIGSFVEIVDNDPDLIPQYGEKTFWYRVQCKDSEGNMGALSAAVAGYLKDTTAPKPPINLYTKGYDDYIMVHWKPNNEKDMDGYLIYRSECHLGEYLSCDEKPKKKTLHYIYKEQPCGGPFILVGSLSQNEALSQASSSGDGYAFFEDHSVPTGSPLCYAYLVKAQDRSQNKSGNWPLPAPNEVIVCDRLRDNILPESAIITGLSARSNGILVEWIGQPIQDIKAYHIYRSDSEEGNYNWVGGLTVEFPPEMGQQLYEQYKPILVGCDQIPVIAIESMSSGSWLDINANPRQIYWYKVRSVDVAGNESLYDKAVPVSTFTFSTIGASIFKAPIIDSIVSTTAFPYEIVITWKPIYDSNSYKGFAVFRSDSVNGFYLQIGNLIEGNEYRDQNVVNGVKYFYKVLAMDRNGMVSSLSIPKSGILIQ